jgi:hypothetical protein
MPTLPWEIPGIYLRDVAEYPFEAFEVDQFERLAQQ